MEKNALIESIRDSVANEKNLKSRICELLDREVALLNSIRRRDDEITKLQVRLEQAHSEMADLERKCDALERSVAELTHGEQRHEQLLEDHVEALVNVRKSYERSFMQQSHALDDRFSELTRVVELITDRYVSLANSVGGKTQRRLWSWRNKTGLKKRK